MQFLCACKIKRACSCGEHERAARVVGAEVVPWATNTEENRWICGFRRERHACAKGVELHNAVGQELTVGQWAFIRNTIAVEIDADAKRDVATIWISRAVAVGNESFGNRERVENAIVVAVRIGAVAAAKVCRRQCSETHRACVVLRVAAGGETVDGRVDVGVDRHKELC